MPFSHTQDFVFFLNFHFSLFVFTLFELTRVLSMLWAHCLVPRIFFRDKSYTRPTCFWHLLLNEAPRVRNVCESSTFLYTLFLWISAFACGFLISLTFLHSFSFTLSFFDRRCGARPTKFLLFLILSFGDFKCFHIPSCFCCVLFGRPTKMKNSKITFSSSSPTYPKAELDL